jgi:hypothetical protein
MELRVIVSWTLWGLLRIVILDGCFKEMDTV